MSDPLAEMRAMAAGTAKANAVATSSVKSGKATSAGTCSQYGHITSRGACSVGGGTTRPFLGGTTTGVRGITTTGVRGLALGCKGGSTGV